jgi:hypothetical protein
MSNSQRSATAQIADEAAYLGVDPATVRAKWLREIAELHEGKHFPIVKQIMLRLDEEALAEEVEASREFKPT